MGKVEANRDMVTMHDLRHDRHTVSLLTDHLVFLPKYRGNVFRRCGRGSGRNYQGNLQRAR